MNHNIDIAAFAAIPDLDARYLAISAAGIARTNAMNPQQLQAQAIENGLVPEGWNVGTAKDEDVNAVRRLLDAFEVGTTNVQSQITLTAPVLDPVLPGTPTDPELLAGPVTDSNHAWSFWKDCRGKSALISDLYERVLKWAIVF
ncbi:hypothetical protein V502_02547 [Pseudogymnoascus sp. VKM F-4520 (FW-2644)]|nr:hypothetical protein V502_02547 [Pseudogymnoascus sp. VKM F-4520 (FW-2644)]